MGESFDFVVFFAPEDRQFAVDEIYAFLENEPFKLHGFLEGRDDELGEYALMQSTKIIDEAGMVILLLSKQSVKEGKFIFHSAASICNSVSANRRKVIPMYLDLEPNDPDIPSCLKPLSGIKCERDYKRKLSNCFRKKGSNMTIQDNRAIESQSPVKVEKSATSSSATSRRMFSKFSSLFKR